MSNQIESNQIELMKKEISSLKCKLNQKNQKVQQVIKNMNKLGATIKDKCDVIKYKEEQLKILNDIRNELSQKNNYIEDLKICIDNCRNEIKERTDKIKEQTDKIMKIRCKVKELEWLCNYFL